MQDATRMVQELRDHHMRVTPQRHAVIRALVDNVSHPTVETLYETVRAELPRVSLKTVYQTVHDLDAIGAIRLLDVGTGAARVDPNVERDHHHLVCDRCGAVRDVNPTIAPAVARDERDGFCVTAIEVIFRGYCETCS